MSCFFINFVVFSLASLIFSTASMFVFRALQTTQSIYLNWVANMRNYFLAYSLYMCLAIVFVFIPGNYQLVFDQELKEEFKELDPAAYAYMEGYIALGFDVSVPNSHKPLKVPG